MRRRTLLTSAGAVMMGTVLAPSAARAATGSAEETAVIDPGTDWGAWEGWGTSLCWWGKAYGDRDDLADIMFTTGSTSYQGRVLPGLGLTIARYNAGACSFRAANGEYMIASPNISPTRQMDGYWLDWNSTDPGSASWDWSVDAAQRSLAVKARDRGADTIELFSNSPMWWMCDNHDPSGSNFAFDDNLQSWNYRNHAVYLATIAKYAHQHWGLDFASVEAFNEPSSPWWAAGTQEGCHFDVSTQQTVLPYLRAELDSRGLSATLVSASDENTYDIAHATWNGLSTQARNAVDRINVHGYQGSGGRRDLLYQDAVSAGKKLWNSEYGESDATGLTLAGNLTLDFRWLHPTAWVYWQALDGGGWGLIQADEAAGTTGAVNTKYYVLAQFSRHIRPGMHLIDGGADNTVAAYDPAARRLVVVVTNSGDGQWITVDLSRFGTVDGTGGNGLVGRWATDTSGSGDRYTYHADTYLRSRTFRSWFPADTVQTFEIDNVSP